MSLSQYLDTLLATLSTWRVRRSRPEEFYIKGVPKNSTEFTGKHLCRGLFCNKVTGLKLATLLKKRLWHRCFPVNFAKFLRTPLFTEDFQRLLLDSVFYCHEHKSDESYIKIAGFFCNANFISDVSQFTQQNLSFCQ